MAVPDTVGAETKVALWEFNWKQMIGRSVIETIFPTFYPQEADANREDRPRLDILLTFENGDSVRHHPGARPIWSSEPQPTEAMRMRMQRLRKLHKKRRTAQGKAIAKSHGDVFNPFRKMHVILAKMSLYSFILFAWQRGAL